MIMLNVKPKIFDCFLFSGEKDLLEIRLNILNEIVDFFVISESNVTFSGISKPYYFELLEHSVTFSHFRDKIIYLKSVAPNLGALKVYANSWTLEYFVRNYFYYILKFVGDNDHLLLSDLDEIPNPTVLKEAIQKNVFPCGFNLRNFIYFFNVVMTDKNSLPSAVPVMFKKQHLVWPRVVDDFSLACNNVGFMKIREERLKFVTYDNAGWHYSSCLGIDELVNKLQSRVHRYFKNEFVDVEHLLRCKNELVFHDKDLALKFAPISIDESNTHSYILQNKAGWPWLFYSQTT